MSRLLDDEIKWINANAERYDSDMHKRAVIGNITKRYQIAELKKKLDQALMRLDNHAHHNLMWEWELGQ